MCLNLRYKFKKRKNDGEEIEGRDGDGESRDLLSKAIENWKKKQEMHTNHQAGDASPQLDVK